MHTAPTLETPQFPSDITTDLRRYGHHNHEQGGRFCTECKAAAEIERLRGKTRGLRAIDEKAIVLLRNAVEQEYGQEEYAESYLHCMAAIDAIAGEKKDT